MANVSIVNCTVKDLYWNEAKSDPSYGLFKVLVDCMLVPLLCIFGLVGNTLSILVLRRDKDRKSSTSFLLQILAVADMCYLISSLFFQTWRTLFYYSGLFRKDALSYNVIEPYVWPFVCIAQTSATWIVVLVTVDRFLSVCKPMHAMKIVTRSKLTSVTAGVLIMALLYNVPRFFEEQTLTKFEYCLNSTILAHSDTDLTKSEVYNIVYRNILHVALRLAGPLSILIVLNIKLMKAVRYSRKKHEGLAMLNHHKEKHKTDGSTIILIAVVIAFILCMTPECLVTIQRTLRNSFVEFDHKKRPGWRYLKVSANFLTTFNSSVNFVIYCLFGKRFRRILHKLVCPCLPRSKCNCIGKNDKAMCTCSATRTHTSSDKISAV